MKFTPLKSPSTVCSVAGLYPLGGPRTVPGPIFNAMASGAALRADITAAGRVQRRMTGPQGHWQGLDRFVFGLRGKR